MKFEIIVTQNFLKKSYFQRIFRNWWKLAIAFCMILFSVLLDLKSESLSSVSTIGLTIMGLCILIYSFAWYKQLKFIKEFIAKQGDTPIVYKLSNETVETESLLGESKLKWDSFKSLRIQQLDTLLEFSGSGVMTLPTNQLNNEILKYLQDRFTAHGKRIILTKTLIAEQKH